MIFQFTLLVTLGFIGQPDHHLTSDQINQIAPSHAKVYTRILERVGNTVRLSGIEQEVIVSPHIRLPRISEQKSDACLSLRLMSHGDYLEIIALLGEFDFSVVIEEQLSIRGQAITDSQWKQVYSIDRFLVRESSSSDRWSVWESLRTENPNHQIAWLKLGGDFFSGSKYLNDLIWDSGFENLASQAGLHPFGPTWISTYALAKQLGLTANTNGFVSKSRSTLLNQAKHGLGEMLDKASRKSSNAGFGLGSQRKSVRAAWGDPQKVDWVRFDQHMIEHWTYQDRHVRLINGRVYELKKSTEVSLKSN
ncbi:MAG: hypothetical protein H2076_07935 [Planctomycetes bacterium]|nr:hypothetical protein [Planctomycetota bacterium]